MVYDSEEFSVKMNVIPIGGYDIILGVHRMPLISLVTFDYSNERVMINREGKKI